MSTGRNLDSGVVLSAYFATAQDMDMEMRDGFAGIGAVVDDEAVSGVAEALAPAPSTNLSSHRFFLFFQSEKPALCPRNVKHHCVEKVRIIRWFRYR